MLIKIYRNGYTNSLGKIITLILIGTTGVSRIHLYIYEKVLGVAGFTRLFDDLLVQSSKSVI